MLLHHTEELNNDFRARSDEDLTLSSLLSIVDGLESIVKNGSLDHFGGLRFSDRRTRNEVSTTTYKLAFMGLSIESALCWQEGSSARNRGEKRIGALITTSVDQKADCSLRHHEGRDRTLCWI